MNDFCLTWGQDLKRWAAHLHPNSPGDVKPQLNELTTKCR